MVDLLVLCCLSARAPTYNHPSPSHIYHINQGCPSLSEAHNFVMSYEKDYFDEREQANGTLLLPSLTPLDCLLFASSYKAISRVSALKQIEALLDFFSLTRNRGKQMGELSLGDQKKVMIAMELIGCPSHLQFRNVFEHLDLLTKRRLEEFLILLNSQR